eukprot:gene1405-1964_t
MFIDIGYDIELALSSPTAVIFLLRVHPSREHDLQGPENLYLNPALGWTEYTDAFGNRCGRIQRPARPVSPWAHQHAPEDLPTEVLQFLLPSRYCEVDSELLDFAWLQFGQTPLGWARVQAICSVSAGAAALPMARRWPGQPAS